MTINLISTNQSTTIEAHTAGDIWIVAEGVYVTTSQEAIDGADAAGFKQFIINGHLVSDNYYGMFLGVTPAGTGGNNEVSVSATGSIHAELTAIRTHGGNTVITNAGLLWGGANGINANNGNNTIVNSGTITALGSGIMSSGNGGVVTNTGLVTAGSDGISAGDDDVTNTGIVTAGSDGIGLVGGRLLNSGTVAAGIRGVSVVGNASEIVNDGDIRGEIYGVRLAGGGGHLFVNRGLTSGDTAGVIVDSFAGTVGRIVNEGTIAGGPGTGDEAIRGDGGDETVINRGSIVGDVGLNAGNDTFDGRGGTVAGTVRGGAGNDLYVVDDPTISLSETAGQGSDTVQAASNFQLGANFEVLNLIGANDLNGAGNGLANTVIGNIGANLLLGFGGTDTIIAGAGDDRAHGHGGNDSIDGGVGDDIVRGQAGNDTVLGGDGNDTVNGGIGNDLVGGGDDDDAVIGHAGDDTLFGGLGDDTLYGGLGKDALNGGSGSDSFLFGHVLASTPGGNRDVIADFSSLEGDVIDLSVIDANANTAGNNGFAFIGGAAFSGVAGQLRFVTAGGNGFVIADTDGDSTADMTIELTGITAMTAGDFVL